MKKLLLGVGALSALLLTGCASIVDGNSQSVSFASNPDGATVYLNGAAIGKTPMTMSAKRRGGPQPLRFTKEGHQDVEIQLISGVNPWFFGNILTGGLLGSTTDGLSGAAFRYDPGSYMVSLPETHESKAASLSDKQQLVNFIVSGYSSLTKELMMQGGQYVTSLMTLANIPEEKRQDLANRLKSLSLVYSNIPEFADKAADLLIAQP